MMSILSIANSESSMSKSVYDNQDLHLGIDPLCMGLT